MEVLTSAASPCRHVTIRLTTTRSTEFLDLTARLDAIETVLKDIEGAFSLLFLTADKLIADKLKGCE